MSQLIRTPFGLATFIFLTDVNNGQFPTGQYQIDILFRKDELTNNEDFKKLIDSANTLYREKKGQRPDAQQWKRWIHDLGEQGQAWYREALADYVRLRAKGGLRNNVPNKPEVLNHRGSKMSEPDVAAIGNGDIVRAVVSPWYNAKGNSIQFDLHVVQFKCKGEALPEMSGANMTQAMSLITPVEVDAADIKVEESTDDDPFTF